MILGNVCGWGHSLARSMYASRPRQDRKLTNGQAFRHGVTTMQSCTHRVETAILLGSGARHDSQECVWLGAFSGEMNVRITTKARSQVDKWPGIQAWCNNHASCTHRVETAILLGSGARHGSKECVWVWVYLGFAVEPIGLTVMCVGNVEQMFENSWIQIV